MKLRFYFRVCKGAWRDTNLAKEEFVRGEFLVP